MKWLLEFKFRLSRWFFRRAAEEELAEEMRAHIEYETEEGIASGMTEVDARRAARLKFGNTGLAREDSREYWGFGALDRFTQDVGYAARMLARNRGFTIVALVSLALGIGATSVIFSVMNAILFTPPPFAEPDRMVALYLETQAAGAEDKAGRRNAPKTSTFLAWQQHNRLFEGMAMVTQYERGTGWATPNLFDLIGVKPILGRTFQPDDPLRDRRGKTRSYPIVLSYGYWQRAFGGDPHVIGRTVSSPAQEVMTVIGVMPRGFWISPEWYEQTNYWFPVDVRTHPPEERFMMKIARMKPGVTVDQARAELEAIARPLEAPKGPASRRWRVVVENMHERYTKWYANQLYFLLGVVGCILLIGCANVAGLLLSRAAAREKEIATRAVLGAGTGRLVRQLLTESLLLAVLSGLLGIAVTFAGIELFRILAPGYYQPSETFHIDVRVLGFLLGVSLLVAVLSGLAPALRLSRATLDAALKQRAGGLATPRSARASSILVITEVALALVLLTGTGLMVNTILRLQGAELGYNPEALHSAQLALNFAAGQPRYWNRTADAIVVTPQVAQFWERTLERAMMLPGVTSAGMVGSQGPPESFPIQLLDHPVAPGEEPGATYKEVAGDYFQTLQIPLRKGRWFTETDRQGGPGAAIVSEEFVSKIFPGVDAVGKFVRIGHPDERRGARFEEKPRMIVGVVGDVTAKWARFRKFPEIYVPYQQQLTSYTEQSRFANLQKTLYLKAAADPAGLAAALRGMIRELDRDMVSDVTLVMEKDRLARALQPERYSLRILGLFAALAVFLASVGLYGMISYSVSRRTHEFGLRMALGASRGKLLAEVMRQALWLSLAGVIIGLVAAAGLTRLIRGMLYGVTPTDPLTFGVVSVVMIGVALLASVIPARRATNADPLAALRHE